MLGKRKLLPSSLEGLCVLSFPNTGILLGLSFYLLFPTHTDVPAAPSRGHGVLLQQTPFENPTTFAPWKLPPLWLHLWGELQPSAGGLHCPGPPCTAGGSACRSCCPKGWPKKRLIHPRGCPGGSPGTLGGSAGLSAPRACIWRVEGG